MISDIPEFIQISFGKHCLNYDNNDNNNNNCNNDNICSYGTNRDFRKTLL